jgi:uncharacterized protein YprB with RNaseH-like and TPR domain
MESLADKLKSLGVVPAKKVPQPQRTIPALEHVIPGVEIQNSLGSCYLSRSDFPIGYKHGNIDFSTAISTREISAVSKSAKPGAEMNSDGLFFLDTETTGLAGGTGTFAFLVGIGYQTPQGFRVDQYLIRDPGEEASMLLELSNFFEKSSIISTFNGKSFDVPLLNARYTLNRLPLPFEHLRHLDLLHLSRRLWRNRLESRALQDLEREILNIPRDENEVPGWMIPEIYFEYQHSGDPSPLAGVLYHNRMDILSLAALMMYISDAMQQINLNRYALNITDLYSMGVIYDDAGLNEQAEKLFLRCLDDKTLDTLFTPDILSRLARFYKRQLRWSEAVKMWSAGAELNNIDSAVELAKYYEHQAGDYNAASYWTNQARELVDSSLLLRYKKKRLLTEISSRQQRLDRLSHKDEEAENDESQRTG